MSRSKVQHQLTFAGSITAQINLSTSATSDPIAIPASAVGASITVHGDFNGTAVAGDDLEVYAQYSNGDVGSRIDTADDFDTDNHSTLLFTLQTDLDGDEAIATAEIDVNATAVQFFCKNVGSNNRIATAGQLTFTLDT